MEGKMFIPLALTVVIALLSSLVLTMTVVPVLAVDAHEASRYQRGRTFAWGVGRRRYQQMLGGAIRRTSS
jgi:cobalt-zinc-cadmium resistance protein CzcA